MQQITIKDIETGSVLVNDASINNYNSDLKSIISNYCNILIPEQKDIFGTIKKPLDYSFERS